jgi:hypothetical protein
MPHPFTLSQVVHFIVEPVFTKGIKNDLYLYPAHPPTEQQKSKVRGKKNQKPRPSGLGFSQCGFWNIQERS